MTKPLAINDRLEPQRIARIIDAVCDMHKIPHPKYLKRFNKTRVEFSKPRYGFLVPHESSSADLAALITERLGAYRELLHKQALLGGGFET